MSIVIPNTFADGEVMDWGLLRDNFVAIRTALNAGFVLGDFADDSVQAEHILRPSLLGFPISGYEGQFRSVFEYRLGEWAPYALGVEWGLVPDRVTICPDSAGMGGGTSGDRLWPTEVGRTFYHPGGEFRATLTASMLVRTDPAVTSYISETDGAGTLETGGYLELRIYDRQLRTETVQTETRRDVYGTNAAGSPPVDNLTMICNAALDAGIYDCYLVYRRGTHADAHFIQIDLSTITFVLECF